MLKCLEILKPSILGVQNRRRSSWYIYRIYVTYTAYKLYTGYRLVKPLITRYKIHPRPRYKIKQFLGFRNIFEKRRTYHLISSHILQIKRVYLLIFIDSPNKKKRLAPQKRWLVQIAFLFWLVVSTHLKNISQIGSFPQVGMKIKNV